MPECQHKPPAGYRELTGEERERHIEKMEKEGLMKRVAHRPSDNKKQAFGCVHYYVKDHASQID